MSCPWGPFRVGLPWDEQKARLRALRLAVRLLTGDRGREACIALATAEISGGDEEALAAAEAEFDRLGTLDRRRVLASYQTVA